MVTLSKFPFKIIAIPFVPILFILGMAITFFAWLSSSILSVLSLIFGVGGVILLWQGDTTGGVVILVMAFLVSPFGLPALAELTGNMIHNINGSIIAFIAG